MLNEVTNFRSDVLCALIPTVVEYWAEESPEAQFLAEQLEKRAAAFGNRLKILRFDVSELEVAKHHAVFVVPTIGCFRAGKEIERLAWPISAWELAEALERIARRTH